jgi:hypothetical protein
LLITIRLSIINLAGTARTLVAVGTLNEPSMLATTRAPTPRIGSSRAASGVLKTGTGLTIGSAGVGDCKERSRTSFCDAGVCPAGVAAGATGAGAGAATGAGVGVADCAAGATGAGVCATGAGVCATGVGVTGAAAAFGVGGVPPRGAPAIGALVEEDEEDEPEEFGLYVLKNSIQDGSSEVGSDK